MTIQQLYAKLCTPEFQDTANGSLNYNVYIYQYPAEKEYAMRENIVDFCDIEHYLHKLLQDKDVAAVAQEIAEMYEAPLELVTKDVSAFADKLQKKGLM